MRKESWSDKWGIIGLISRQGPSKSDSTFSFNTAQHSGMLKAFGHPSE